MGMSADAILFYGVNLGEVELDRNDDISDLIAEGMGMKPDPYAGDRWLKECGLEVVGLGYQYDCWAVCAAGTKKIAYWADAQAIAPTSLTPPPGVAEKLTAAFNAIRRRLDEEVELKIGWWLVARYG